MNTPLDWAAPTSRAGSVTAVHDRMEVPARKYHCSGSTRLTIRPLVLPIRQTYSPDSQVFLLVNYNFVIHFLSSAKANQFQLV